MRCLRRERDSLILSKEVMGVAMGFELQEISWEGIFVYYLYHEYITAEKSTRNGRYVVI